MYENLEQIVKSRVHRGTGQVEVAHNETMTGIVACARYSGFINVTGRCSLFYVLKLLTTFEVH